MSGSGIQAKIDVEFLDWNTKFVALKEMRFAADPVAPDPDGDAAAIEPWTVPFVPLVPFVSSLFL